MSFKLNSVAELFPNDAKALQSEEKEYNYGMMFKLSEEEKKTIVKTIDEIVAESKRQRETTMEIKAEGVRNYEGVEKKNGPWRGSSNISTMVTTIAADMMHAKLFPMAWNPEMLHFQGVEKHGVTVAKNNEVLMRWALTKDMENTQDKADDIIHRLVIDGTIAVKTSWETYYTYVTDVKAESVSRQGKINYNTTYRQVQRQRAKWIPRDLDYVYFQFNAENEQASEYIVDEVYYTLPMLREMKADGYLLPDTDLESIKGAVEKTFDPEGTVKARYQSLGIEAYYARVDSYPIKCYEAFIKYDINKDDRREECIFLTLPEQGKYLAGKPLHCVSKTGRRPWLIRPFLRRPGCMYGKGIPELVRHLHKEMNAIHNQRIDAGNMVLAPFFFYRAASGFEPSEINVRPATGIPLDDPQRDVYFPDYNPSRLSVSFQEENIVMDLIQKLTYLTPAMLGQETAERPTARGTMAVIAQGEQKFGLLGARVQKIFCDLITMTRKTYEENMPEGTEERILGDKTNQPIWGQLSPEMIAGDYDCVMPLDLTAGDLAFEKQADQIIYQTLRQDPIVAQNPAFVWEITAGFLTALGKLDIEKYIGPKPDIQDNPGIIQDENMMLGQEQNVQVHPGDDDVAHMNGHQEFKRKMANVLTPNAMHMLVLHILEHRHQYAMKLQQQAAIGQQGKEGQPGTGQLNAPGMSSIQGPRVGSQQPVGAGNGQA
jgi:hypothetical protein